ncbi:SDR family oxidoreductase [Anaerococcus sp. NML200574]|uniref:SDR family NAD(P)-dependent oxidoreductase n=1 Tax=Anaerococcus sp. NML200574 TaxID=2954486 RepID=UPI002238DF67|nr:SDR family oxidoreductase [Anaerococcus sp. NML200574]MCW6678696.1 SDR family oxidoreductase [Anaerococcus sp. NML200574]
MKLLEGKVAIITGSSRGIGYAVAEKFLDNGAKVAVLGSREESANKALANLKEKYNQENFKGYWPKLTDEESVKEFVEKVLSDFGKVDILVNCAGVSDNIPSLDADLAHFANVMNINVNGTYNMIHKILPHFIEKKGGVIVNFSSMVSKNGQQLGVAYPASKFAINGLTISLARELGPYGIRVNAVAPGVTNTDMVKVLPKEQIEPVKQMIPLKRIGEPEDVANAVLFLASDMASYVSGEILYCDGATFM